LINTIREAGADVPLKAPGKFVDRPTGPGSSLRNVSDVLVGDGRESGASEAPEVAEVAIAQRI
jgi:hypothetical protein